MMPDELSDLDSCHGLIDTRKQEREPFEMHYIETTQEEGRKIVTYKHTAKKDWVCNILNGRGLKKKVDDKVEKGMRKVIKDQQRLADEVKLRTPITGELARQITLKKKVLSTHNTFSDASLENKVPLQKQLSDH